MTILLAAHLYPIQGEADTVYDLFTRGELPGRKVGRKWRTTRNAVLRWIESSSADDTIMHAMLPCAILVSPSLP